MFDFTTQHVWNSYPDPTHCNENSNHADTYCPNPEIYHDFATLISRWYFWFFRYVGYFVGL